MYLHKLVKYYFELSTWYPHVGERVVLSLLIGRGKQRTYVHQNFGFKNRAMDAAARCRDDLVGTLLQPAAVRRRVAVQRCLITSNSFR